MPSDPFWSPTYPLPTSFFMPLDPYDAEFEERLAEAFHPERQRGNMTCSECGAWSYPTTCYFCSGANSGNLPDSRPPWSLNSKETQASYANLIRTIEEFRAGRAPTTDFEELLASAIRRNQERDRIEQEAFEALPTRFDRVDNLILARAAAEREETEAAAEALIEDRNTWQYVRE